MSRATLLYLCSAVLLLKLGHDSVVKGYMDLRFELEDPKKCKLADLNLKNKEDIIECFPEQDANNFTRDGSSCLVSVDSTSRLDQNEIALKQCVHGVWTEASLGEKKNNKKRFFGIVVGIALCYYFCPRGGGGGGTREIIKKPPTFNPPCRPPDLLDTYYVQPREDKVTVTWTKPSATDPDGTVESITVIIGSDSGSEFEGSVGGIQHVIAYEAIDNDGLSGTCYFDFTVKKQTCESAAPWPLNGQRECDLNAELGSICTYSCHNGYTLSGNTQVTCEDSSSPSWTSIPRCEKVRCPILPGLENGIVTCSNENHTFLTTCTIQCNTGFILNGSGFTQCQEDGTWLSFGSTSCIDQTAPELSCLTPQVFYADRATNSTSVLWELPTAVDEVDQNTTVVQTDGQEYGSVFQSGSTFVKYIATDSQGNESPECTIEIRVEVTSCQHPIDVIQDTNMTYSCTTTTYMYGTECTLSCKFNLPLMGTDLITCEQTDPSNLAVGTWSWGNGTKPFCNQTDCPPLDPPVNGALAQGYAGNTLIYTMLCNDQFDIPVVSSGFTGQFICLNSGVWNPNIEVPDCVEPRNPRAISLPVEIFYYSGDCSDPATQEQIKSKVQQILEDSVNVYIQNACQNVTSCTTSNLQIICGDTTTRRKRRAAIQRGELNVDQHQETGRQKRQTPPMIVEFFVVAPLDPSLPVPTSIGRIDVLMDEAVKPLLQELFQNETFDIAEFTVLPDSMQIKEYGDIVCSSGQVLRGSKCYPCPAGYFKNSTDACQLCPVGKYSDAPGNTNCTDCPEGTTTLGTGSKNQSQCLAICPAGQVSADGTLPCTPCRVGYYQSGTGQTECDQCTTGTTEFTGSVSSDACKAFQILIDKTTGVINAGSISENMSDLTLMFWTKRYANLTANASLILTSAGSDAIVVHLSTDIEIQIPDQGFHFNVGSLTSSKWTHVGVTWNTTNGELSVYINGALQSGIITLTAPSSPLIPAGGNVLMESTGITGVYMADLHVEDAVVPASEIESVSESCWNDRPDDVFSLNDLRFTPLQGVTIQAPASCDPVDECADNPCNNHTCIKGEGTYTCLCSGGWSGDNCTTPPDYCINHGCVNGATCVNGNNGYTCTCLTGYSGDLCDSAPVDGGWSEYSEWTACTVTCGGGTQSRTKSCDSPEPTPYGNNCSGDAIETQACGQGTCPTCGYLSRGFKMTTNCIFDNSTNLETCNVSCRAGYVLPPSLSTFTFTCGLSTNYTWKPMPNPPNCVDAKKPNRTTIIGETRYRSEIAAEDTSTAEKLVTDNLSIIPCVASSTCTATVGISNPGRKRSSGSTAIVTLTVEMTEAGALDIQNYLETSTASASFQELIDAINSLEESASVINTSSSSIFDITVNGVTYTSDPSTLTLIGNVTCPTGETAVDGVCAACPEGTYYTNGYCNFCEKGTYTLTTGETTCTACPAGLTTTTIGSYAASQCIVIVSVTTTADATTPIGQEHDGNSESEDGLAMYIGLAISGVVLVVSLTVFGLVFHWKFKKTRIGDSTISVREPRPYSREGSTLTVHDVHYDFKTAFHNPSYNASTCQIDKDLVQGSDRVARSVFQHKGGFSGYANVGEMDSMRPRISPPPPYQRDENGYVKMDGNEA